MNKFNKIAIPMVASILLCTSNVFAAGENLSANGKVDISLQSTSQLASSSNLYTVDGTGQYRGYKMLKGYPNENKFQVYYSGDINSYSISFLDLRGINLNEVVTWTYNGVTHRNTKGELYNLFSDGTWIKSQLGVSGGTLSEEWFQKVFGNTYEEWVEGMTYFCDAESLVEEYFEKTGQSRIINNVTLTPDFQYEIKTDFKEVDGETYFQAYDKQGNLLGNYSDGDDYNLIIAKYEGLKTLPPKLSDGWINTDLLQEIYGLEIKEDGNDLVFQTDPSVTNYQEFLRLNLPNGWLTDDTLEAKVNGVKLKKYTIEDNMLSSEWIDRRTLDEEYGIYCGIGDSIDDFKLYSPYDFDTITRSVLFSGTWPSEWQENKDQIETDVDGLRIKRENNLDYFNVRDLQKFSILPNSQSTRVIYLNIKDLQEIGLIK